MTREKRERRKMEIPLSRSFASFAGTPPRDGDVQVKRIRSGDRYVSRGPETLP
jgi:hypothetical protein